MLNGFCVNLPKNNGNPYSYKEYINTGSKNLNAALYRGNDICSGLPIYPDFPKSYENVKHLRNMV